MGYASNGTNTDIMLLRYNIDGTLDNSFGINGCTLLPGPGNLDDKGLGLAVNKSTDEIVVTGFTYVSSGNREILTAKFSKNGGLISTVIFSASYTDIGFAVTFQPDGKILVCGETRLSGTNQELIILRYNNDLSVDSSFGSGGKVVYNPGTDAKGFGISMQGNDKIIVCGSVISGGKNNALVLRYSLSGIQDNSFGSGGVFRWNSGFGNDDFSNELVLQSDGKILIAGNSMNTLTSGLYVLRLTFNGTLDNTFGIGGVATYTTVSGYAQVYGIAVSSATGNIIVCGTGKIAEYNDGLVLRLNSNGMVDVSFATAGVYLFNGPHGNTDAANGLYIQNDRRIVVTGYSSNGTKEDVLTLRLK